MLARNILAGLAKAARHPGKLCLFARRKFREALLWNRYYVRLRSPKRIGQPELGEEGKQQIADALASSGFKVVDYAIDPERYSEYFEKAKYEDYPHYRLGGLTGNLPEKSLEHYLASEFLELGESDIYMDVANSDSPTPEIYRRLFGCQVYRQDLSFPEGLHGNTIGGDAANMPVPAEFASKMALHCSFEHFEGDSDIGFIKEAGRVLKPGGKLCILPLYLNTEYAITTDPVALPRGGINFEKDAVLYCKKGWANRHGRNYDVAHLRSRVGDNIGALKMTVYRFTNTKDISQRCYINFAAVFEKPSA